MRYLLVGKGDDNPSTRYRLKPLAARLDQLGHTVNFSVSELGPGGKAGLLSAASRSDVVIVQRKLFGGLFVRALRACCSNIVFDFDDAVFANSDGSGSLTRERRFAATVGAACRVWAGNRYLAAAAEAHGAEAYVLPTAVRADHYDLVERKHDSFTLVWIGGRSTSRYLQAYRPALEAVGKACHVRLKVIGDFDISFNDLPVVVVPWSEATETEELLRSHIGIAPMENNSWTRGKCALKVLQYMAAGLPVISSKAGANAEVVRDGSTGLFAETPAEWVAAVKRLQSEPAACKAYGAEARAVVRSVYDIPVVVQHAMDQLAAAGLLAD